MITNKLLNIDFFQEDSTSKILEGDLLVSSHGAGWQNIVLEHWSRRVQETPIYSSKQHSIVIRLKNLDATERKIDGVFQQEYNRIGDIVLVPAHVEHWANFKQDAEVLVFSLAAEALATTIYVALAEMVMYVIESLF